jgi:hypothetical protein
VYFICDFCLFYLLLLVDVVKQIFLLHNYLLSPHVLLSSRDFFNPIQPPPPQFWPLWNAQPLQSVFSNPRFMSTYAFTQWRFTWIFASIYILLLLLAPCFEILVICFGFWIYSTEMWLNLFLYMRLKSTSFFPQETEIVENKLIEGIMWHNLFS